MKNLLVAFTFLICSTYSFGQAADLAKCYADAARFLANAEEGTIDASKLSPTQLNNDIQTFRVCIIESASEPASYWFSISQFQYLTVLWSAIALAQDGLLNQMADALEQCNPTFRKH